MTSVPQDREALQREGDELDAKIRKAEREVAALEVTLAQMFGANHNYGASFKKVDNGTAFSERAALREKLDRAYDRLKFRRQEEAVLVGDVQQVRMVVGGVGGTVVPVAGTVVCSVHYKIRFRRQEEAVLVGDVQQVRQRGWEVRWCLSCVPATSRRLLWRPCKLV